MSTSTFFASIAEQMGTDIDCKMFIVYCTNKGRKEAECVQKRRVRRLWRKKFCVFVFGSLKKVNLCNEPLLCETDYHHNVANVISRLNKDFKLIQ